MTIISRVPLIAADILLIYITWTKLRGWIGLTEIRQSNCKRLSLSVILFHGGRSPCITTLHVLHVAGRPDFPHRCRIFCVCTVVQSVEHLMDSCTHTGISVLSTLNLLHLVLSVTAVSQAACLAVPTCMLISHRQSAGDADPGQSLVSAFTAPYAIIDAACYDCPLTAALHLSFRRLTATLISRFLLTLQEANQMVVRLHPDDPLYSSRDLYNSTPSFISSLGGFVNPDLWPRSDEDDNIELQARSPAEIPEEEPPQAAALTSFA